MGGNFSYRQESFCNVSYPLGFTSFVNIPLALLRTNRWCEAEPVVSEAEWLPLISDALPTAKHGKAVGPDALPSKLLKTSAVLWSSAV